MKCLFLSMRFIYFTSRSTPKSIIMPRMIYDYTKSVLERVSFDHALFQKELRKAAKNLLPYEQESLRNWLEYYTKERPELKSCVSTVLE